MHIIDCAVQIKFYTVIDRCRMLYLALVVQAINRLEVHGTGL